MKNLKVLVNIKHSIIDLVDSQQFTIGTSDYNNNIFIRKGYVFVYKEGDIFSVNPVSGACLLLLSLKPVYAEKIALIAMFYNSVFNSLTVTLENGDVLSILLNDDFSSIDNEADCVGNIGSGLQVAVLSPDTETIVFLTGDNTLILMSGNFEPIDETDLLGTDEGEQKMINVGWGKKETQFHGSEGKAAAKNKITDEIHCNSYLTELVRRPNISWRGDSTLFAVSYCCPVTKHHKVKIFDKGGRLQCTSEVLPGLESVLSWRPSGNLIALTQKLPNKHVICFIEKNGLRHGDFALPPNLKVQELSWNSESTILSAVCIDESQNHSCILLWTMGNYHWYLKQRLNFSSGVVGLHWDDAVGNLAHILLADGTYHLYQWTWTVDHSVGVMDEDLAVVAVIDGYDVKLSAFKKCIIPPPMCGATVTLPSSAQQIVFSPFIGKYRVAEVGPNDLCVYLSDGRLGIVKGMETAPHLHCLLPVRWKCSELPLSSASNMSHWQWISPGQLLCVVFHCQSALLCLVQLDDEAANVVSTTPLDEPVLTISQETGSPHALVQLCSGKLLSYQEGRLSVMGTIPEPCVSVSKVVQHTIARTHNSHLYMDGELLANNVTSYFCLPQFLVLTLSSHKLYVTSVGSGFKMQSESEGTTDRRLERGATLVIVTGHSVVLQLPRGNLETIQPRALTLVTAAQLLDAGDYKQVAQLLRRQRIDLNLCVDHNPNVFLMSVSRFVAQVQDPQWLSVFLAELNDKDVTRTTYAGYYNSDSHSLPLADKVNRVCTALREAMTQTETDKSHFLQPILSTYVRSGRVAEAIALADTDQALSYLTLLIDTDRLYNEALGAYNLDKALKIAGKSLKDPKEYVAYLNELREMNPSYMRFTIDKRLRKPQSALRNLAQCEDKASECLQYIKDTGLYTLGLELFRSQPAMYREVCLLYASHLLDRHNDDEAGLMYRRAGEVEKALSALSRAGSWRHCLTLAKQHNYSESSLKELQETLYSGLLGRQDYTDAATLCDQLGWGERSVSCSVKAHNWSHAIYLSHSHSCSHLVESVVKPAVLECQSRTLADLRAKRDQLDKHSARLQVVRLRKANADSNFDTLSDMQSDTSSLSSFSTSSAGTRTTKNTRKAQRKLWSLKEGSPREEQALLYTISELIQNTERLTGEVHCTCVTLAEFGLDCEALALHSAMISGLDHLQQLRHSVWPASAIKKTGSDAEAIDPTPIDMQLSFPPTSCVSPSWKLNIYT